MSNPRYIQNRAAAGRVTEFRIVKGCEINESPEYKRHRLAVAFVRMFVTEFPDEAVKIVRELVPDVVK